MYRETWTPVIQLLASIRSNRQKCAYLYSSSLASDNLILFSSSDVPGVPITVAALRGHIWDAFGLENEYFESQAMHGAYELSARFQAVVNPKLVILAVLIHIVDSVCSSAVFPSDFCMQISVSRCCTDFDMTLIS